jgi:WD40 repeat protein
VWEKQAVANPFLFKLLLAITASSTVNGVSWSPDGSQIAGGLADSTATVWDSTSGKSVFTYQGHHSAVTGVAWSPDGKRVASWGADHTVQVWHLS